MRSRFVLAVAVILGLETIPILWSGASIQAQTTEPKTPAPVLPKSDLTEFNARLLTAITKHLDLLLDADSKVVVLKGKGADGMTALSFYQIYELTGNPKYRTAAVALADRILADMKATKHGVLYINEKDSDGESIDGGGPPAFGWYTSSAAYILHKEGGRKDDLKYIATVIDNYPWSESGWWANSVDIKTGQPKEPLTKPGAINKSATMAMCAGMVGEYVKSIDPELATRLKVKTEKCIYKQIIPAQEADGFWHYGLKGTDPKNKDILGYFMVTTHALIQLQQLTTDSYRDKAFQSALDKANAFALKTIAPMTDPNQGSAPPPNRKTAGTPSHYTLADEPKRGFQLGILLFAANSHEEGIKLLDAALKHFREGNAGMEGAHAAQPAALILSFLRTEVAVPKSKKE